MFTENAHELSIMTMSEVGGVSLVKVEKDQFVNSVLEGHKGMCLHKDMSLTILSVTKSAFPLKGGLPVTRHRLNVHKIDDTSAHYLIE